MSCPHRDTLEKKKCYLYRYHQIFLKEVKNYVNFYKYIALVDISYPDRYFYLDKFKQIKTYMLPYNNR